MRITRETLLKIARDTAAQRVRTSRRLICVYLTGSLLGDSPLIGGTADIDLVCIHDSEPPLRREIVGLAEQVHLDIAHYSQADFSQPRRLRQDPWLGSFITNHPLLLHDSAHWFDFTQAAVTAQFNDAENILARASSLASAARQSWLELSAIPAGSDPFPAALGQYLKALENAGNAFACLAGAPLPERRFWLDLPERADILKRPGLAAGLADLLAAAPPTPEAWQSWQVPWQEALAAAGQDPACPARLHPARRAYYLRSAAELFEAQPAAAVWLALRTWTQAAALPASPGAVLSSWQAALPVLNLSGTGFAARLSAFDAYLDSLEETLDDWAKKNGIG